MRGRRENSDPYLLPRHVAEVDRLDIQHFAMRDALGANYLSPLMRPQLILDVGCGTGQWAFELCAEFPEALAIGLDLEPSKPDRPANYGFVKANLLDGLPFQEGRFDFVHQRLLQSGVPLASWSNLVNELVRVARPGGWIELVEIEQRMTSAGPASTRLFELLLQLSASLGLDGGGVLFRRLDEYLRVAGLAEVERHHVTVPLGDWGGRVGSLMASDLRVLYTRMSDVFQAKLGVPVNECHRLIAAMSTELNEYRTVHTYGIAFGRKPV